MVYVEVFKFCTEYKDLLSNTELQHGNTLIEGYPSRATSFAVVKSYLKSYDNEL